nr:MAG TPA: hypothetical protein [Caudoviricetes sp.]
MRVTFVTRFIVIFILTFILSNVGINIFHFVNLRISDQ